MGSVSGKAIQRIDMPNQKRAILLMISAIACFAMMDAMAKMLSTQVHPIQTI
jgi:hypothetical protein